MALTEIISDPTRRVFWLNSYGLDVASRPTLPQTSRFTGTETVLFLKSGSVSTGTQTVSWGREFYLCSQSALYQPLSRQHYAVPVCNGNQYPVRRRFKWSGSRSARLIFSCWLFALVPTHSRSSSPLPKHPRREASYGRDAVFTRSCQQQPVSSELWASFSLSEVTALNGGSYAFQIGTGTVSVTINNIAFNVGDGGGWFEAVQAYGGGFLPPGSQGQFYVNSRGNIQNSQVSANPSQFPASALLPLALLQLDAVGRIMELDDYRPA